MTSTLVAARATMRIEGAALARRIREHAAADAARITAATGRAPALATVLVGEDPASTVYLAAARRAARAAGITDLHHHLPADATRREVTALLDALAVDPEVSGILLQLPLPAHLDAQSLIDRIPAHRDVDGLTTASAGNLSCGRPGLTPCTPAGVVALLEDAGVALRGARVVVVGWGALVGRPLAQLLLQRGATVTVANEYTRNLPAVTRTAEVLVVATGVPALVGAEHVAPGAVVVDVGVHQSAAGLVGDVRTAELEGIASQVTPVPGGVGPMTTAVLLANTIAAARGSEPR
jgi:methylenetetrahydrofolate dehydrogenase (NADP+)/methenyltetrahydrofolate cyclohydrolase